MHSDRRRAVRSPIPGTPCLLPNRSCADELRAVQRAAAESVWHVGHGIGATLLPFCTCPTSIAGRACRRPDAGCIWRRVTTAATTCAAQTGACRAPTACQATVLRKVRAPISPLLPVTPLLPGRPTPTTSWRLQPVRVKKCYLSFCLRQVGRALSATTKTTTWSAVTH